MKRALALLAATIALVPCDAHAQTGSKSPDYAARVARVLRATPLIDGHNDWPEALREREGDARWTMDLIAFLADPSATTPTSRGCARARSGRNSGRCGNVLRVLEAAERVRDALARE